MHKDGFLHGIGLVRYTLGLVMWVDLRIRPHKVSTLTNSGALQPTCRHVITTGYYWEVA